ncbi:hypothetical protein AB4278_24005 [Vibrio splendidus]
MKKETTNDSEFLDLLKSHPILVFTCTALLFSGLGYWTEYTLFKSFGVNIVVFASLDDFFLAGLKYPDMLIQLFAPILFLIVGSYVLLKRKRQRLSEKELETNKEIERIESKLKQQQNHDLFGDEPSAITKHHTSKKEALELELKNLRTSILKERSILVGTIGLMFFLGTCVAFFLVTSLSNKQIVQIKKTPEYYSKVFLRDGSKLPAHEEEKLVFISATDKFVFFSKFNSDDVISIPIASITHISQAKVEKLTKVDTDLADTLEQKAPSKS